MKTISIDRIGGNGDGMFDNSEILYDALHTIKTAGSGTLIIPPGVWCTGPIELPSNCILEVTEGATLQFIADFNRYEPVWTRWEGVECYAMHPCILVREASFVKISGKGTIDGNGSAWWDYRTALKIHERNEPKTDIEHRFAKLNPEYEMQPGGGGGRSSQFLAPPLVQFYVCTNVEISDVTLLNSPFWTLHPVYCEDVTIQNVTIRNPYDAPNTDGIDIDSCARVIIRGCTIDVGDDAIALKSGSGLNGMEIGKATKEVTITDCVVKRAHGGVVIGSETAGGVSHVTTRRCTFEHTDRGIRIKTRRGRGGAINNLSFTDCTMVDNLCPIAINMYYRCGILEHEKTHAFSLDPVPVESSTPSIDHIDITHIRATGCKASAGFFIGLPESPIRQLSLEDVQVAIDEHSNVAVSESEMYEGLPETECRGMRLRNCTDAVFRDITVQGHSTPFMIEDNVEIDIG